MNSGAVGKAVSNIHNNLGRSLDYITNSEKTEKKLLVSGVNCYNPENFSKTGQEFKKIQERFYKNKIKKGKTILAHHYLISFDPKNNVNAEEAHRLSEEIVNRFLKKQYQVVLSTHIDKKEHIHTHVIFNAFNKNTGEKYESSPAKLREFKQIINEVCLEHNLNPINKKKYTEKAINLNYGEWLKQNNILDDKKIKRFKYIQESIKLILKDGRVKNLEQLAKELKERYQIETKYKNYKTNKLYKNISFKTDEWEQSIRGKYDISLENIMLQLKGRKIENNRYQKYCIENNTNNYKDYIKNAIDTELNSNAIVDIDNLAAVLKSKYNIEMKYLTSNGRYLNRFKFKALDSNQKNFIGSASLDKEHRNNYELEGIRNKISSPSMQFSIDLRENLKILNRNLLASGKKDRWGINIGLDYMTKKNLRTHTDIDIRRTEICSLKGKNKLEIEKISKFISNMEITYERLKKKMIEIKSIEKEIQELGIFNVKQKKKLFQKMESIKVEIQELKESEFYQKKMKYSEKLKQLDESKQSYIEKLKEYENESNLIYSIETIDKNKDSLMRELLDYKKEQEEQQQREKNFNKTMGFDLRR